MKQAVVLTIVPLTFLTKMLEFSNDAIVFGQNMIWAVSSGITALIFAWRFVVNHKEGADPNVLCLIAGVAVEGASLCIHRLHWAGWRWTRAIGADGSTIDFYVQSWIPTFVVITSVLGAILITAPASRAIFGSKWLVYTSLIALAIWIVASYSPGWYLQSG